MIDQYHSPEFADWTSPEFVIISGDRRSNRPEVFDAYTDRGAHAPKTSRAGAVSATICKAGVRVLGIACEAMATYLIKALGS